jgi:hypothetical protein
MVELLLYKCEAPNSNPSPTRRKRRKEGRREVGTERSQKGRKEEGREGG